ncbi:MAG TPA: hypothetical protein VEX38_03635, partial [Fimbriimonadaceae bacterium]|nr:hypothetical protein [Fimbriimonadaceae bacterium]
TRPTSRGPFMETGFDVYGFYYNRIDGSPYRKGGGVSTSLTFKDGTDFDVSANFERINGSDDLVYFLSLEHPRGDPYRRVQLDYGFGQRAGRRYQLASLSAAYRPIRPLQLTASVQGLQHFTRTTQTIFGANYDLGNDMSLSSRMVKRGSDTNVYLAFRRSGGRGAEYFLILGDPNSLRTQRSLVLKVVLPFELRF